PDCPTSRELGQVMDHSPAILAQAVEVKFSRDLLNHPEGLIYRYCFDKLFSHLSNINRLLMNKQLHRSDLRGLKYWLSHIAAYPYAPSWKPRNEVFQPYVGHEEFGYIGIIELGKKLGVTDWDVAGKHAASRAHSGQP